MQCKGRCVGFQARELKKKTHKYLTRRRREKAVNKTTTRHAFTLCHARHTNSFFSPPTLLLLHPHLPLLTHNFIIHLSHHMEYIIIIEIWFFHHFINIEAYHLQWEIVSSPPCWCLLLLRQATTLFVSHHMVPMLTMTSLTHYTACWHGSGYSIDLKTQKILLILPCCWALAEWQSKFREVSPSSLSIKYPITFLETSTKILTCPMHLLYNSLLIR